MVEMKYCPACGDTNHGNLRGSLLIFFLLCLFLFIPGLIYLMWMLTGGQRKCRNCGNWGMIPVSSPIAQQALNPQIKVETDSKKRAARKVAS